MLCLSFANKLPQLPLAGKYRLVKTVEYSLLTNFLLTNSPQGTDTTSALTFAIASIFTISWAITFLLKLSSLTRIDITNGFSLVYPSVFKISKALALRCSYSGFSVLGESGDAKSGKQSIGNWFLTIFLSISKSRAFLTLAFANSGLPVLKAHTKHALFMYLLIATFSIPIVSSCGIIIEGAVIQSYFFALKSLIRDCISYTECTNKVLGLVFALLS